MVAAGGIGQQGLEGDGNRAFMQGVLLSEFGQRGIILIDLRGSGFCFGHFFPVKPVAGVLHRGGRHCQKSD